MNREIKFRAWEITKKYMIPFHQFGGFVNPIDGGNNTTELGFRDTLILMQYTGLKDKNGKEIYEGDYLRQEGLWVKVIWSEFDAGFVFEDESGSCMSVTNGNVHNWEIDGNIYES